jgi:hypothetical protein
MVPNFGILTSQLKLDRRFGVGEGKREAPRTKREGKAPRDHPSPRRKRPTTNPAQKGKGETATSTHFDPIPLGNQTARTYARTKRNDFPIEHSLTSDATMNECGNPFSTKWWWGVVGTRKAKTAIPFFIKRARINQCKQPRANLIQSSLSDSSPPGGATTPVVVGTVALVA